MTMERPMFPPTAEIISFTPRRVIAARCRLNPERKTMHTVVFRSRKVILEVDEATLLHDVRFNFEKAERKLVATRRWIASFKERAAKEIQMLTAAEAELSAAVDAARAGEE